VKKVPIILLSMFIFSASAMACTGFIKKTTGGDVIYARTNEFAADLNTKMLFIPRKTSFSGSLPNGKKGIKWTTKYAMMGVGMFDMTDILDGINEKGLGFGAFYFPEYVKYATFDPKNTRHDMAPWEFGNWILGNFATVDQVKDALSNVRIVSTPLAELNNIEFPLHFFVFDKTGKAIVIEPMNGKLKVFDDPVGAITNSPPFDWHLINLNNYVNLSATNVKKRKLTDTKLFQTGQGSGMLGLPGDFTPPSRLVRIVALSQSALPVKTAEQGVNLAWNIIDNINIPKGATRDTSPDGGMYLNYTQDVVVYDINNLRIYFRNYYNPIIRMVDMKKLDMNSRKILRFTMFRPPQYADLTGQLKPITMYNHASN
jgi:choloylglycine hydrolase